jgi:hypothetical protein
MNDAQVLQLLVDRYLAVPAPAPSAALAIRMDEGRIGTAGDDRRAVVVPLIRRPRLRVRYLVAALVAGFAAMSGLAAAGALPDPLQRGVASVASHLGIDLPNPDGGSGSGPADGRSGGHEGSSGSGASGSSSGTTPSTPTTATLPGLGGLGGVPTPTLPPVTAPPVSVPPVSLPVTVPPLSLPPVTVPPLTVPPISLPPISLPPLLPGL